MANSQSNESRSKMNQASNPSGKFFITKIDKSLIQLQTMPINIPIQNKLVERMQMNNDYLLPLSIKT